MFWFYLALLGTLFWTSTNVIDKHILSKYVKQPLINSIFTGIVGLVAAGIIFALGFVGSVPQAGLVFGLLAGVFWALEYIFYFKALSVEEVSRVIPIYLMTPVLVAVFAAMFLGEIFSVTNYLGILLLVAGAITLSIKKTEKFHISKGIIFISLSAVFGMAAFLCTKVAVGYADYLSIFFWIQIALFLSVTVVFVAYRKELFSTLKKFPRSGILITGSEGIGMLGMFAIIAAISLGPVTLVSAVQSLHPLFTFLLVAAVTIFFPRIIKEDLSRGNLIPKLLATVAMVVGAILIL